MEGWPVGTDPELHVKVLADLFKSGASKPKMSRRNTGNTCSAVLLSPVIESEARCVRIPAGHSLDIEFPLS